MITIFRLHAKNCIVVILDIIIILLFYNYSYYTKCFNTFFNITQRK